MACINLLRIIFDVFSLLTVCLPTVVLNQFGVPYTRGFFCDDNSIKYPDKADSISIVQLFSGSLILVIVVCIAVEIIRYVELRKFGRSSPSYDLSRSYSFPQFHISIYRIFSSFLFGLAVSSSLTTIIKFTVGGLRPNFLAICQPNFATLNCTSPQGLSIYVDGDVCTRPFDNFLRDSRISFPSGHATEASYVAVFLALYLQSRMSWKVTVGLRSCFQASLIFVAAYVCSTRITSNRHHPIDVLAGAAIGSSLAALSGLHLCSQFKEEEAKDRSRRISTSSCCSNSEAEKMPLLTSTYGRCR